MSRKVLLLLSLFTISIWYLSWKECGWVDSNTYHGWQVIQIDGRINFVCLDISSDEQRYTSVCGTQGSHMSGPRVILSLLRVILSLVRMNLNLLKCALQKTWALVPCFASPYIYASELVVLINSTVNSISGDEDNEYLTNSTVNPKCQRDPQTLNHRLSQHWSPVHHFDTPISLILIPRDKWHMNAKYNIWHIETNTSF